MQCCVSCRDFVHNQWLSTLLQYPQQHYTFCSSRTIRERVELADTIKMSRRRTGVRVPHTLHAHNSPYYNGSKSKEGSCKEAGSKDQEEIVSTKNVGHPRFLLHVVVR